MVVFALAKIAVLAGRPWPMSAWAPLAFVWQDIGIVLALAAFEQLVRREWPTRIVYGSLVALTAINVPVERVLSSPLTAPMLRATRGTLADSIRHEATATNIALTLLVAIVGFALPAVWPRRWQPGRAVLAGAVTCLIVGALGAHHVDTGGLDRNSIVAIVGTALPRIRAHDAPDDWRAPIAAQPKGIALEQLRGAAAGKNVLLVVLESTGAEYLRAYGAAEDPTPQLTQLAARSVVFDNAYAVYPESVKGLVAVLASRFPAFDLPAEAHAAIMTPSLATALAAAGYRTGLFHSGRFMYLGMEEVLAKSGFGTMEDAGDIGGNRNSSFGIDELAAVRRVLQWIDAGPHQQKFLAAYLPIAGHHPYSFDGPRVFAGATDLDNYRNALHEGDAALGVLFEGLRARGLAGSTVTIVIGDHGEAFGQHPGNFGHDLALYEENVRVPLIINVPGGAVTGSHSDRIASLLDIAPTILDLLGRERPAAFQGGSLLDAQPRMALFFTDYSLGLLGVRDGCFKEIYELESGRAKLFDLCGDAAERIDLAQASRSSAEVYRERLKRWSADQVARVWRSTTAP